MSIPRLSFKAGRCHRQGATPRVLPDARHGTLSLEEQEDELLHLCWRPRGDVSSASDENSGAEEEDDLIVFPEDATFERVEETHMTVIASESSSAETVAEPTDTDNNSSNRNGRIYALKFKSSDQVFFYWMQGADASKDAARVEQLQTLLGGQEEEDEAMAEA